MPIETGRLPWQERPVGGYPSARDWQLRTGAELWRLFMVGELPRPPLANLFGLGFNRDGEGVTCTIPGSDWFQNAYGYIPVGVIATAADAALGWAFGVTQAPGAFYTTAEMKLNMLRPVRPRPGLISCQGRLIHAGQTLALTEVRVLDQDQRLVAHGTSLLVVRAALERGAQAEAESAQGEPPSTDWISPLERPVQGASLASGQVLELSGIEVMQGIIDGDLPTPPLQNLTGLRFVEVGAGTSKVILPATGWLRPPTPFVQGGILAMQGDLAAAGAIQSTLEPGTLAATVDLKTNFHRPVAADNQELAAVGRVVNRGRTMAVAVADTFDTRDRLVATTQVAAMLMPGARPE